MTNFETLSQMLQIYIELSKFFLIFRLLVVILFGRL